VLLTRRTQLTQWLIFMNDEMIFGDITLPTSTRDERLSEYCEHYRTAANELDQVKEKLDYLKHQILSELPEEYGEVEIPFADSGRLKINTPEKFDWDKAVLAKLFDEQPLPECVSQNFTVNKRLYDAADELVKDKLREALTIKRGTVTVKVLKT
jgi:hypothetical protein